MLPQTKRGAVAKSMALGAGALLTGTLARERQPMTILAIVTSRVATLGTYCLVFLDSLVSGKALSRLAMVHQALADIQRGPTEG